MTEWMKAIQAQLPPEALRQSPEDLAYYGCDWTSQLKPAPSIVVLPNCVEQVQAVLKIANEYRVAVVPSGGRTGLSGGALAANGELVLAFDRMNKILEFNQIDQQLRVQAGVVTQAIQDFARSQDLFYPVDFASSGSSQIGGNIATNAGGINVIRYGMTRQWVQGLTVVLADGSIIETNQGLYKNATGYDLRHLMIGSEGTLGVIVEARLQLMNAPKPSSVLVLGIPSMAAIMEVLKAFRGAFVLNAFEFFSHNALEILERHRSVQRPFEASTPFYALIEVEHHTDDPDVFNEEIMSVFETLLDAGLIVDGVISQSSQQAMDLWVLREGISEAIAAYTPYKNDISVLPSKVPQMLQAIESCVAVAYPEWVIVWFGHIGDGNLHLNILKPNDLDKTAFFKGCAQVTYDVAKIIQDLGGSISAEHGVGIFKKPFLNYARSQEEISLMKAIKYGFDPNGILNPGKIFDRDP